MSTLRMPNINQVALSDLLQSHSWRDDDDQPHSRIKAQVRNLQILEKDQEPTDGEEIEAEAALKAA